MGRNGFSRRGFLAAGVAWGFPAIIPSRVLGSQAPSKKIQVGVIGCGRIAGGMDIPGLWHNQDLAVPVALADCDIKRLNTTRAKTARLYDGDLPDLKLYQDYRALLADKTVDVYARKRSTRLAPLAFDTVDVYRRLRKPADLITE